MLMISCQETHIHTALQEAACHDVRHEIQKGAVARVRKEGSWLVATIKSTLVYDGWFGTNTRITRPNTPATVRVSFLPGHPPTNFKSFGAL